MLVWFALGWVYWMAAAHGSTAQPSKCPGHKCQHCAGTMGVKEIVFRPVWLELRNLTRPVRPPPALDSS
jgi:hypothetical protein